MGYLRVDVIWNSEAAQYWDQERVGQEMVEQVQMGSRRGRTSPSVQGKARSEAGRADDEAKCVESDEIDERCRGGVVRGERQIEGCEGKWVEMGEKTEWVDIKQFHEIQLGAFIGVQRGPRHQYTLLNEQWLYVRLCNVRSHALGDLDDYTSIGKSRSRFGECSMHARWIFEAMIWIIAPSR